VPNWSQRQPLLWATAALALVALLLLRAPSLMSLLLGAFIVAYVCAPAVDRLARRLPRSVATALVMVALGVVVTGLLLLFVPLVTLQWRLVVERLPRGLVLLQEALPKLEAGLGIDLPDTGGSLVAKLQEQLTAGGGQVAAHLGKIAGKTFGGVAGALGAIVQFTVLVPMLAFYILLNYHAAWAGLVAFVPPRRRDRATRIKEEIDIALGGFVRGQLTVAAIIAALLAVGFSIVGIDGAVVIGLLGGLLNMIPLVGAIVTYVLAILMAVLKFAGWGPIVGVVVVLAVAALLEQMVVTPRILGGRVGLPPLAVLLAVLGAGEIFGFVGMLLAVPGAAVVKVLLQHARQSYVASEGFTAGAPAAPVEPDPPKA
jgi:predicted PurR-regulated permease PerM